MSFQICVHRVELKEENGFKQLRRTIIVLKQDHLQTSHGPELYSFFILGLTLYCISGL